MAFITFKIGIVCVLIGFISTTIISQDETTIEDDENSSSEVPIIRQINKINEDGTYTYGYEAADGSFKIETRDVLGNLKGMFGFIDESGGLKRVSYTANNSSGYKNRESTTPNRNPIISSGYTTVRSTTSQDSSGRRPVLILKHTPGPLSSTKNPVIQHIPKKTETEEDSVKTTTASYGDYISGRRVTNRLNLTVETTDSSQTDGYQKVQQTNNPLRKILVSKRPLEEKDTSSKGKGGNALRRQLGRTYELRGGDINHVYSGGDPSAKYYPHISALMSDLRPRASYVASPNYISSSSSENIGYAIPDSTYEDVADYPPPSTTTEIPFRPRHRIPKGRPVIPVSIQAAEEASYSHPVAQDTVYQPQQISLPPLYNVQPPDSTSAYSSLQHSLREELMAIIHNYLQARLSTIFPNSSPYYSYGSLPIRPVHNNYYPPSHQYYPQYPSNQHYIPAPLPYPPPHMIYPQPSHLFNPAPFYTTPGPIPYVNPNIQLSSRHPNSIRSANSPHTRYQTIRSTTAVSDDADLLQMLLTSPTRIPIHQLNYDDNDNERTLTTTGTAEPPPSSSTSEWNNNNYRPTQPVRNVQIISESSSSRPVTTEPAK